MDQEGKPTGKGWLWRPGKGSVKEDVWKESSDHHWSKELYKTRTLKAQQELNMLNIKVIATWTQIWTQKFLWERDLGQRKDQKVRIFYTKFTLWTKNYHTIYHGTSHDLLGLIVHVLSINLLSTENNQLFDRVSNKTSKGQYLLCFLSSS